jgi:undecaprenyl-diphosphatase
MEEHLGSPFVIAAALIVYGVIFIVIENVREHRAQRDRRVGTAAQASGPKHLSRPSVEDDARSSRSLADAEAPVQDVDSIGWGTAIGIGLFQVL